MATSDGKPYVIASNEIIASGELILDDLVERYESEPGFMFTCRIFSTAGTSAHYCWWLFTDGVAIQYQTDGATKSLLCWAAPHEAQRIRQLVVRCCPF